MMNIETIQKNKLGTILRFSIPSIISMLLSTIITITDGYFTGNYVGEDALGAVFFLVQSILAVFPEGKSSWHWR